MTLCELHPTYTSLRPPHTTQVFDLQTGGLADELAVASDTVNGCDFHPFLNLLALATGAVCFPCCLCQLALCVCACACVRA